MSFYIMFDLALSI